MASWVRITLGPPGQYSDGRTVRCIGLRRESLAACCRKSIEILISAPDYRPVKPKAEILERRIKTYATISLAVATMWLAVETRRLSKDWRDTSEKQISALSEMSSSQNGVHTWLAMEARFDSKDMARAMKKLAAELEVYSPTNNGRISEQALDFFEDIGMLYDEGQINKELALSSFGYDAARW